MDILIKQGWSASCTRSCKTLVQTTVCPIFRGFFFPVALKIRE